MLVDGNITALELWSELERIFTMPSTKAVRNLQAKLEATTFKEGQDWEKNVSKLLSILDEPAPRNTNMTDAEKITKLLQTLPPSFGALAMASSQSEQTFDQIFNAVQADIERTTKIGTWPKNKYGKSVTAPVANYSKLNFQPFQQSSFDKRGQGRVRGRYREQTSKGQNPNSDSSRTCHYCERSGDFIRFCRFWIPDETNDRIGKPSHHHAGHQQQQNYNSHSINDSQEMKGSRGNHFHMANTASLPDDNPPAIENSLNLYPPLANLVALALPLPKQTEVREMSALLTPRLLKIS